MAKFNLDDYETVEERIRRFYELHKDGRITSKNLTTQADRSVSTWVVEASVFLTAGDQAAGLPKATGLAFEVDGEGMAQKTAALETCETSAIGRALKNAGIGKSVSREEMAKAERGVTPKAPKKDWAAEADKITDVGELRWFYTQAKAEGATEDQLERIEARGQVLSAGDEDKRDNGSVSSGKADAK